MSKFCLLYLVLLVVAAAAAAPKSSFNDELVAAMDETAFCDSKLVPLRAAITRAMEEGAKATPPQTARTILFHEYILYCGRARRNQIWALAAQLCAADVGLYVQCNMSNVVDGNDGARLIPVTAELRDPAAAHDSCDCGAPPPADDEPAALEIQRGPALLAREQDDEEEEAPLTRAEPAVVRRGKKRAAS